MENTNFTFFKSFALALSLIFGISVSLQAQQELTQADATLTACTDFQDGDTYTDSGGSTGNYSSGEETTFTLCALPGQTVTVTFTAFDVEASTFSSCFDNLTVTGDAGAGDGTYAGDDNDAGAGLSCTDATDDLGAPTLGPFTSADGGCLAFFFDSDGSVQQSGWEALISVVGADCPPPPTCELVCPEDEIFNLGPGECSEIYSYAVGITGDGCEIATPPVEGFTGAFTPDPTLPFPQSLNLGCGLFEDNSPTSISLQTVAAFGDPGNCSHPFPNADGADPDCDFTVGTVTTFFAPFDGVLTFDWDYETEDAFGPFWDYFWISIGGGFTQISDDFGADIQSGTFSVAITAGTEINFVMQTVDGIDCAATVEISNLTFVDPTGYALVQLQGDPSGTALEPGVYPYEFEATSEDGLTVITCSWEVTVEAYAGTVLTALACNDLVQISLDGDCEAVVGADVILEGGPYGCYDDYIVEIEGINGDVNGVSLNLPLGNHIVTVTDPNTGNNCWGEILVEDKLDPVLECDCPIGDDPGGSISGALETSDPDFNAGAAPGQCWNLGGLNPGNGVHFYDVASFTVTAADQYQFECEYTGDALAAIFDGPFDPNNPCDGLIAGDDDNAGGLDPRIIVDLVPGITYTLVTTSWGTNSTGDYSWAIGSAAGGEVVVAGYTAPECLISCAEADALIAGIIPPDLAPTVDDNCGATVAVAAVDYNGEDCGDGRILVTYVATDAAGNTASCTLEFVVEPLDIDDIVCPDNYEGECTESIDPSNTGWPTYDGTELTSSNPICNIFVEYWDKPLTDCGGGQKIIRTFTILDWCTQEVRECVQIIKLSDNEGPVMTCPDDFAVGTDFWYCYANVSVPKPTVFDACGSDYTLQLSSTAGIIAGFGNNYVINELPIGTHTVTWTATDACDNESTCSFEITVEDDVPPVPNCDEHTIVSLTNDGPYGVTLVPATVFDDGSYDNCSDVTFKARRMETCITFDWTTNGACIDDNPNGIYSRLTDGGMGLKPCVPFACCDVGQGPIMIELEVTDGSGNKNYCMVEIEVQDKLAPFIECPPDIIVSCDFWFDSDVVTGQRIPLSEDPMTPVFGTVIDAYDVHGDEGARQPVIINDPGRPTSGEYYLPQPYTWGIDGWADDNCDVNLDVRITIADDCSGDELPSGHPDDAVRYIERRFTATDGQNNSDNCRQRIWVVDFDRFYIADQNCNNSDRNDGVIWPCDKTYTTCPDEVPVDEPTIFDDNCSLIGVTYDDTRFDFVDGACYKILREWTVIDWCQYDTQLGTGLWTYTQVIKVIDNDGPAFLDCPAGPVTLCAADEGVSLPDNNQVFLGEENPNSTHCSVHLEGSLTVEEFCSDYVIYDVKVYPFNGPDYIQLVNKTQVSTDENGQAVLPYNTRTAPVQAVRLNGLPYNSPFCGDYHRVLWSVEDGCGNTNTCEFLLRLEDCKQPSPVCINGLSTVVMPVGGTVTIWAKEFDASSIDDCTKSENLLFSFSGDTYQPSMAYTCDNVAAFGAELSVQIWVADEGVDHNCNGQITWSERNKDYCTTTIVITDNDGVCGGSGSVIAGEVMTHADLQAVENTNILLTAPGNVFPTYVTVDDGQYSFIAPLGNDYTINADRNDDHKNGVSTLDLVRIQKHLLGVQPFDNPYDMIAADANNSESVSAIDLVELRKLILGIYTELPNNTSWRFVDAAYDFVDPSNPWPFDETAEVMNHQGNAMDNDFEAVKVGDVNNTVVSNATQVVIRNANGVFNLVTDDREVVAGETVEVTFSAAEFNTLVGYQFTMNMKGLEFNGVAGATTDVRSENIGVVDGKVTASWHNIGGVQVNADEALFTFEFVATANGTLSQMLDINSTVTEAEAYNKAEDIMDIALTFRGAGEADFALYQNEPNPFNGVTVVGFDLPEAGTATLTVFDVTGKVVKVVEESFAKGYNRVEISSKGMSAAGVMYYRLDAGEYTATKKMVIVK